MEREEKEIDSEREREEKHLATRSLQRMKKKTYLNYKNGRKYVAINFSH